jgi:hypothetical protein
MGRAADLNRGGLMCYASLLHGARQKASENLRLSPKNTGDNIALKRAAQLTGRPDFVKYRGYEFRFGNPR